MDPCDHRSVCRDGDTHVEFGPRCRAIRLRPINYQVLREDHMDNTTMLIIILLVLLLFGGVLGRGRWW